MKKLLSLSLVLFATTFAHAQFMNSSSSTGSTSQKSSTGLYSSGNGPKYESSFGFTLLFTDRSAGPCVDYEGGCRIRDYVFVGAGLGVHDLLNISQDVYWVSVPIYANFKGFLPVKENVMPFINFSIGAHLSFLPRNSDDLYYGLFTTVGLGVELGAHRLSLGYECDAFHCGFFKYAVRF